MLARGPHRPSLGIRINPEHSEAKVAIYDPCAPGSRLGVSIDRLRAHGPVLDNIQGLHFHNLCQLDSGALQRTLAVVERRFGPYLEQLSWINFGGGHRITSPDYDVDALIGLIRDFKSRRGLDVYLEPSEAVAYDTGILIASVLDIFKNGDTKIAILDTSATAHMPDVLEMPYRPMIFGAGAPGEKRFTYRLGGLTCLAGDVVGDYSFAAPLQVGQKLVLGDMAHYSMVKNTTFNGVNLPAIGVCESNGEAQILRSFGYEDYKCRLG
jgi:carboxynorspermidine decarboxylase